MDFDDLPVKKAENFTLGQDVSKFSVEEIEAILVNLGKETERLKVELQKKKASFNAAHSLFKK